jgi:uridine kinase
VFAPSDSPLLGPPQDAQRLAAYLDTLTVPSGTVIVGEGEHDRDMYFVVSGEIISHRAGLDVGGFGRGESFGELALVAGEPRSHTVEARSEVTLQRLTPEKFERLVEAEPELASRFLTLVVAHLGRRLGEMTDSVDALLHERGLPRTTHVEVMIEGRPQRVPTGTLLSKLLPEEVDTEPVVAALLDRRATSLVTPILAGGVVEPLTTAQWEGARIYKRSIGLLLLEAAVQCRPDLEVTLEHSLGYAQHVRVRGNVTSWAALAEQLTTRMLELVDADLPLQEKWWTVDVARTHFEQVGWMSAAELLRTSRESTARVVSFGQVHALRIEPVAPRTGMLSGFCVLETQGGLLLVHGVVDDVPAATHGSTILVPDGRPAMTAEISARSHQMMRDHVAWLETMGVTDVAELNHACIRGDVSRLIQVAEGHQEKRIGQIADLIASHGDELKVVCIAGPSSSGKSTFIRRLQVQLQVDGVHPRTMSLDDYYADREAIPRGADGEYDLEAFEALRSDLLQEHLRRLLAGEVVATARYDFRTGEGDPAGGPSISLGPGELLVLEGIHGLNPRLLATIPGARVFRVFVCPLAQLSFDRLSRIHASDLRLLRRIVRDRHGRNTNAAETIARWPSVRDGERQHIFAYQHHADVVFDSSLIYELSVLEVYAQRYLLEVPQDHPSYTTAFRLLRLLDHFVSIYPDHVPPTSILREFIGGSGFEY